MRIALDPLLMIIPFLLVAIWVTLYSNRRVRVDHYHHTVKTQSDPPLQQEKRITERSARYIVIVDPDARLEDAQHKQLGVK